MNNPGEITLDRNASRSDFPSLLVYIFVLLFIVPVPYVHHVVSISASIITTGIIDRTELINAVAQIIILSLLLIPLALLWPRKEYRGIYRTWLIVNTLSILTLPVYSIRPSASTLITILHIGIFILYGVCILFFLRMMDRRAKNGCASRIETLSSGPGTNRNLPATNVFIALLIVSVCFLPWITRGALGSLFDTFLQLLFGLVIGFSSMFLLDQTVFQPLRTSSLSFGSKYFLGGSAVSVALLLLGSAIAFPYGGMQILLMLALPGLGWVIAALELFSPNESFFQRLLPLGLLVGLIASAPLVLIDPDELILLLNASSGEVLGKAIQAAFITIAIILLTGVILILLVKRRARLTETRENPLSARVPVLLSIAVIISLILNGLVYTGERQKGLHGDYLFVIMKEQADVTAAQDVPDHNQRRQFVYRTLVEKANTTQEEMKSTLDRFGISYKSYYLVNGLMLPDNPIVRVWLQTRPEVDRVLDNPMLRPLPNQPPIHAGNMEAPTSPKWNITSIEADRVWEDFNVMGEGVIIGQSDSGVQGDHPELADSYRGNGGTDDFNWYDPWNHTKSPTDIMGHGTHTLGNIVGKSTGVAPKATWIGCVNLARNLGNPANYLDCMQFMLAPFPQNGDPLEDGDPERGAHVLNNSWGCPDIEGCDPNTFLWAARALRAAGVFFVAGAGNDGPTCGSLNVPPPIYKETFSVGAIDRFGNLANFSSIGPVTSDGSNRIKPEILAPGVNVLSSLPGSTYGYNSGTSMSGPHVVGVVALIWSANPSLIGNIERTEQLLTQTARPYTGAIPDCPGASDMPSTATGYGILNAYAAVKLALGK